MFKPATIALVLLTSSASATSAQSYFSQIPREQNHEGRIELGTVNAADAGSVDIHVYHGGRVGALLGSTNIHSGVNANVQVSIRRTNLDVIALLRINGEVVDTLSLEFHR